MPQGPGSTRQNNGPFVVGGFYNTSPFSLVDGQGCALQLDVNGNLKVAFTGTISGGNAAAGPTGAPVPADADFLGVNIGGTLFGVTGFNLPDSIPIAVAIVNANGDQITSFGGGIQFPDNAPSGATPTGTLAMGWDSVNSKIRALKVDASQNLLVEIANASLSVTQGTSPWVVSFSAPQHTIVDSGSISATQGTSPWVISGSISFTAPQHVIVDSGTLSVTQGTSPWVISGSISFTAPQHVIVDSGAVTVSGSVSITGTVGVTQSTSPWVISFNAPQHVIVDSGTLSVTQGTSPWITEDQADGSVSGGTAGTFSQLAGGIFNSVAPVLTNGQQASLQLTSAGALIVSTGGAGGGTSAVDESSFIIGSSSQTPVGGVFLGGSNVPTVAPNQTGTLQITADRKLVVFDPQNVTILDLLQTLILETRAMRSAIVYMVTENQDVLTSDFDPSSQDFQPVS